ncbi:MAG: LacI family DNA-binding transcriptional regulator [Anaerolineae bacterium]|nr:LacI family DNA-binding transcriptional regulator [Anaerolineae bacterium]
MSDRDRVTMADVAREVGVSMMTVSRVINDKGDVSSATRQRVLDAIERLSYRPSSIARGLATRRTGTLGLVVPDVANPFFAEVARGVEHVAYAEGYNVFLCNTDEDPERELDVLGSLEEKRVDGIVLCSSRLETADLELVIASHPAVVLLNRRLNGTGDPVHAVLVDDELGGRLATEHLLSRGHRAVGFLSGPPGSRSGHGRLLGHRAVLSQAGVPFEEAWVRNCAPVADAGRDVATQLLSDHPELTALLCYNDLVAVGVLRAAAELGRRVPSDLAVVGFDDIPLAALVTPPLTTCRVARCELGVRAVDLLLRQIAGAPMIEETVVLEPELVVRESAP